MYVSSWEVYTDYKQYDARQKELSELPEVQALVPENDQQNNDS